MRSVITQIDSLRLSLQRIRTGISSPSRILTVNDGVGVRSVLRLRVKIVVRNIIGSNGIIQGHIIGHWGTSHGRH